MARRLGLFLLGITLSLASSNLPQLQHPAFAQDADMDAKGEAEAKEALRLYKQGFYEEAAKLFAKLSVDHPDMLIFERNLGACFYYLRKPEPALSNLRHYLGHKKDIEPDDKVVVERWIGEMEKLREQNAVAAVLPVPTAPVAVGTPAEAVSLSKPQQAPLLPQAKAEGLPPTAQPDVPVLLSPAPVPAEVATNPAAIDLTTIPAPSEAANQSSPFYAKWWFWGTVGVVAAGSITAYLLATHGGTQNACSGGTLPCYAIK